MVFETMTPDPRRVAVAEVVRPVDGRVGGEADRKRLRLRLDVVFPEELDRPIARAQHAYLGARQQSESVLEADERAAVQPEEVLEQVAEICPAPAAA